MYYTHAAELKPLPRPANSALAAQLQPGHSARCLAPVTLPFPVLSKATRPLLLTNYYQPNP